MCPSAPPFSRIVRFRSATLAAFLLAASTAAPAPGHAAPSAGGDRAAEVRAAEIAFARSLADRDLDAFAEHIAEESIFYGSAGPIVGRAAIVKAWKSFFDGPVPPFSWGPEHVDVLESGTLAHSSGPVLTPDGKHVNTFNSVWRLEADGRWRVVFDKGCRVCPPSDPAVAAPSPAGE